MKPSPRRLHHVEPMGARERAKLTRRGCGPGPAAYHSDRRPNPPLNFGSQTRIRRGRGGATVPALCLHIPGRGRTGPATSMTRPSIETTLRLKIRNDHEALAAVTSAIAKEGSLVRQITTHRVGLHHIVREVAFDTLNEQHTAAVVEAVRAVTGVVVEDVMDRTFERHRGGIVPQQTKI